MLEIIIILMYNSASSLLQQALGSLKFALQCAVDNISLSWDLPPGLSVKMLSPEQLTIFRGQRLIIYAQLTGLMPVSPYPYSFFSFFFSVDIISVLLLTLGGHLGFLHLPSSQVPILSWVPWLNAQFLA